jgi:hypothetical protein
MIALVRDYGKKASELKNSLKEPFYEKENIF